MGCNLGAFGAQLQCSFVHGFAPNAQTRSLATMHVDPTCTGWAFSEAFAGAIRFRRTVIFRPGSPRRCGGCKQTRVRRWRPNTDGARRTRRILIRASILCELAYG